MACAAREHGPVRAKLASRMGVMADRIGALGQRITALWGGKRPSEFRPHARRHGAGRL